MNRSQRMFTGFIAVVLLIAGILYLRTPHGHHELSSTEADGRPVHGNRQNQEQLRSDNSGGHVHSHHHTLENETDGWLYENRNNVAAGHSFVLLKPLENAAPNTTDFYAYHLSQYGQRHQHFVIVRMNVQSGRTPLNYDALYTKSSPANNFYSVSAARGENPFRLIELLHGVNPQNRATESRANVPAGVNGYGVTMFDGLLMINNADFNQHLLRVNGDKFERQRSLVTRTLDGSRRANITSVVRFEHINDSPLSGAEYVALKYVDGATKNYYLIHRLQGKNSYQHITQVEFEQPVNLEPASTHAVLKSDLTAVPDTVGQELVPALSLVRDPNAAPEYNYAVRVNGAVAKFRVVRDVLWLPMTPL